MAIAIHNIPEGVCVAMPIYYSTGSRLKAFMWATLSGVSEPIGALFGYLILGGDVSNMAYGSMFGVVAGMMIYISLIELLPSAYRFASNPVIVTASLVCCCVHVYMCACALLPPACAQVRVSAHKQLACLSMCSGGCGCLLGVSHCAERS